MSKIIETRISQKHDFESRWVDLSVSGRKGNFVPKEGEVIVYDSEVYTDATGATHVFEEAYLEGTTFPENRTEPIPYARIKVGDGITRVYDLKFSSSGEGGSGEEFDPTQEFVFYCGDSENLTEDPFNTAEYIVACGDADDVNDLVIPYEKDALQVHIDDKNNPHNVTADQIGAASKAYVDNKVANVTVAVDSALSSTSTNAVQNKVVKAAIDSANTAASNAQTTANAAMPKAGGTFTGVVTAQNNTSYTTKQVRNIVLVASSSTIPTGANGDICLVY